MVSNHPLDEATMYELVAWLTPAQLDDPDVHSFVYRLRRAHTEEKQSNPTDWSSAERAAYGSGDWREFSRLRGYTIEEIDNFGEYVRLAKLLDARYGADFAISIDFDITQFDILRKTGAYGSASWRQGSSSK